MRIIPISLPTPFYIGPVNVYLIAEDPVTLIDTGPKTKEANDALHEGSPPVLGCASPSFATRPQHPEDTTTHVVRSFDRRAR